MEYVIVGIIIVLIIAVGTVIFLKSKRDTFGTISKSAERFEKKLNTQNISEDIKLDEYVIQMEMIPVESITKKNKLIEITDSNILTRINNLIPSLAQAGNAVNNAIQAAQTNGEVLYKVIIPSGAKLADSKAVKGAVRGFYHGKKGIRGHADLVSVETQKGNTVAANTASAAIGVASMVVGQYYMTQINEKLCEISDEISKISDFQHNEYRSRIFSLMTHVKEISDFQIEIIENNELRISKISQLNNLEEECTKLLGQANLTLVGYTHENDFDYDTYEKKLPQIKNWHMYQKSLLNILYKISELKYTMHLGSVSRQYCADLLPTFTKQVSETQECLAGWHQATVERLNIDISEIRRKRDGFDGVMHFIPGLFNDELNFKSIDKNTIEMIKAQSSDNNNVLEYDTSDLYSKDVQLIAKDGKIYFLPMENEENEH